MSQELYLQLSKTYPDIISLSMESRNILLQRVIRVIDETYPRYDNYTLVELAEILDESVDTVVDNFFCNFDPND